MLKLALVVPMFGFSAMAAAQTSSDEPAITFKTNIYDTYGELNEFSLVIGVTTAEGEYIDVDCGFGKVEYEAAQAAFDPDTQEIGGTFISCKVSKEGIVKIYGDASKIDYLNASGCYIEWIEFPNLVNMDIIDLSHNELKRLDLSHMTKLRAIYLSDNAFTAETPLVIGGNKPNLSILEVSIIEHMDQSFNLSDYPSMLSFDGYHNTDLRKLDPSGCPNLVRLTLDVTHVETLDVSKNPELAILNISETRITSIDVSKNPKLTQFYCSHQGSFNTEFKLDSIDLTNNPELVYLFCAGNKFKSLDLSKCPKLTILSASDNYLTSIDVSNNTNLYQVYLNNNCLDFATLPADPGSWNTYYYNQRNMDTERSYQVGHTFDFSSRVLREGTTTEAVLYTLSESSPESPSVLDASYYTYADGKFTINAIPEDSVYIAFANTMFPEMVLRTNKFKIKSADDFGKPAKAASFAAAASPGSEIAFAVGIETATSENPIEFFVDLGDGKQQVFTATSSGVPSVANVKATKAGYGQVTIYMPEGVSLTALELKDVALYSIDVTASASLRTLRVANAGIYSIDLSMSRCLETLDLSGNNLSMLSLVGSNSFYEKNALRDIDLSNNRLSDVSWNDLKAIHHLDISHNELYGIDFSDADNIETLNISYNKFEEVDFTYCSILSNLDISHNSISSIVLPTENNIQYFACNDNMFTLANLPEHGRLADESYIYAPQADYVIATKGPGIDLSGLNRVINGEGTKYEWKDAAGNVLKEGVDYTITNGNTKFINTTVGNIYCEMTHSAFPGFTGANAYKTTMIEAAGSPTNEIASFTTVNDGDAVSLSLAAAKVGTAIYFDWNGDGNLTQYMLGDTYRLFSAATKAGVNVKVYTYEPEEAITVFSMTGAKLSSFDGSNLVDAINVSVSGAGLSEIKLPKSNNFKETALDGNNFAEFDLSQYPALTLVSLNDNALSTIDLTKNTALELVSITGNKLTDIKLANNNMWALYLDHNEFTEINLDGVPNLSQFSISNNKLRKINLDNLQALKAISVVGNCLTFKTLPMPKDSYAVYYYANQAPIEVAVADGVVDLSEQKAVGDTATVYTWFIGAPAVNDYGELEGEALIEGTEYTISDGVTTFLKEFEDVMCVMTNAVFPNVYMYTQLIDVKLSGVESVEAEAEVSATVSGNDVIAKTSVAGLSVKLYSINGALVRSAATVAGETVISDVEAGVYILTVGSKACKVVVK